VKASPLGVARGLCPEDASKHMRKLEKFDHLNYIRFITSRTYDSVSIFGLDERFCNIFVENLEHYRGRFRLKLFGFVIMPDHFHLLLLPRLEDKLSKIMMSLKGYTARRILDILKNENDIGVLEKLRLPARASKKTRHSSFAVFQPGDYIFNVFSPSKFRDKLDYIHNNPVKKGLVKHPSDYKWSSYRFYTEERNSAIKMDELDEIF
jgi:putative transposase